MQRKSSSSVKVFYPRYSREEVLKKLAQGVEALQEKLPLKRVMLFGSYALRRHTVASDIDVLVVYGGEAREDAYALVKKAFALYGLEPHVYAEAEFQAVQEILERMVREGIVIL